MAIQRNMFLRKQKSTTLNYPLELFSAELGIEPWRTPEKTTAFIKSPISSWVEIATKHILQ